MELSIINQAKKEKICIIVPTYNNSKTIKQVIISIKDYCEDIIVVNDGSTDNTEMIIKSFKETITRISYPNNRGKGYALMRGLRRARALGFNYAISIDSDGQHYADDIVGFVKTIQANPNSFIIGSREMNNPNMPNKNSFANKFSNFWYFIQTGIKLKDTQTGYRLYPINEILKMNIYTKRYETELEILVRAAWRNIKIIPIPIKVYYPKKEDRVSHFRPTKDFIRISCLNTIFCFCAIFYGLPKRLVLKLKK